MAEKEIMKPEEIDVWLEEFLSGLLDRIGLDIWVSQMDIDENTSTYTVQLDGDDKSRAIGRDGQMLNSLQHLAISAAANRGVHNVKIIIDVDGYRDRRDLKLEEDANYVAQEVLESGRSVDMEPMCARDRRMVHMYISRIEGVTSESQGHGRERYVRIVPHSG